MIDLLIKIFQEIEGISKFLQSEYGMHGAELSARISKLNSYHARIPEIIATTESLLINAKANASEMFLEIDPKISATVLKIKIENECYREIKAYRYAERLDSACIHQLDGLRSQLSYLKSLND